LAAERRAECGDLLFKLCLPNGQEKQQIVQTCPEQTGCGREEEEEDEEDQGCPSWGRGEARMGEVVELHFFLTLDLFEAAPPREKKRKKEKGKRKKS
jgi:hypothetical protein